VHLRLQVGRWLDFAPEHGCEISALLPAFSNQERSGEGNEEKHLKENILRRTMPKKILVVDDSKTALMMEREILERRTSYQCVTASDGREAVEKAQQERPDLILMDVVMPNMNGFEACKMMRQQASTREIPIVLVTTRGEESYMEAGFQSGCNDYITKPIDSAELVALLQSYLGE
jgi:PleD family two-component response regulator